MRSLRRLAGPLLVLALSGCRLLPNSDAPPSRDAAPVLPEFVDTQRADLPAPRDLRAHSDEEGSVPLQWEPVLTGDVAGYAVERSVDAETYERIAAVQGRFVTSFVDRGGGNHRSDLRSHLGEGETYHYRVRAFDSQGRLSAPSDSKEASTGTLPEPPAKLRTVSHLPRHVALHWSAVANPRVAGYEIWRSPSNEGRFEAIARVEGRFRTHYLDEGLGDLRVFYYRVASVSAAGTVGEPTDPTRAVTKAEPLPPMGLCAAPEELTVNRVSWQPNVEPDLAGYRVLRFREGSPTAEVVTIAGSDACVGEEIAGVPEDSGPSAAQAASPCSDRCSVSDPEVAPGELLSYAAVAFDADGLESDRADRVDVISKDYDLTAETRDGAVHLHWDPEVARAFEVARIFRSGLLRRREIARVDSEGYVDFDVEPGHRYRYLLQFERSDGTSPPASEPVEIHVPGHDENAARDATR